MLNLLLLIIVAILVSFIVNREIEEVLPPFLFTVLIGIYIVSVLGKSHHSLLLSYFTYLIIWIIYMIQNKRLFPKISEIKEKFKKLPVGFMIYLIVCVILMILFSTHFVTVWDDFHYNATFPKNMFYYGTMPVGHNSCTHYKDYLPLMQIFFYWGFQSINKFSEPLMFQYKIFLVLSCMLPYFKLININKGIKRVCILIVTVLLPFLCLFEIYFSLSMDTVMALFFAYVLISIFSTEQRDWFFYYKIISGLMVLCLIKSISMMFVGFSLFVWLIVEIINYRKNRDINKSKESFTYFCVGVFLCIACFINWKSFCLIHGNSTYLSEKLLGSVNHNHLFSLPDYGVTTIKQFIYSLWNLKTNLGVFGFTIISSFIFVFIILYYLDRKKALRKEEKISFILLIPCLILYIIFLLYTYLFIFDQWEAECLSSLDRYFGTIILVMLYVVIYKFFTANIHNDNLINIIITLVIIVSVNYTSVINYLIPLNYQEEFSEEFITKQEVDHEISVFEPTNMKKGKILLVNNSNFALE